MLTSSDDQFSKQRSETRINFALLGDEYEENIIAQEPLRAGDRDWDDNFLIDKIDMSNPARDGRTTQGNNRHTA
jgi:hypothetical protein